MERGHKCRPLVITKYSIVYSSLAKNGRQLTKNGIEHVLVHLLCNTPLLLGFMLCATNAIDICKLTARLGYVECDSVIGR
ncbi:hypothetical protein BDZ91DRAFT_748249 [Kalaharituber pfeilii]|nr:hypothetical protein BDZ91DRAFT_748249 [Kalaharituber pfeilii]